jgi:8-oxo-dGTP diphosphatase
MVDPKQKDEKNSDGFPDWLLVVAAALFDRAGRCLMHQRPSGKMYAGLWEFPGGKVEADEFPAQSLVRELHEELGIVADEAACQPAFFAQDIAMQEQRPAIVLLLYTVNAWAGEPQPLEGGAVEWFAPTDVFDLAMPPLDRQLAEHLFALSGEKRD